MADAEADPDGHVRKWVCACGKSYVFNQSLYFHKKTCTYFQESRGKEPIELPPTHVVNSTANESTNYQTTKKPPRSFVDRSNWADNGTKKAKSRGGKPEKRKKRGRGRPSHASLRSAEQEKADQEIEDKKLTLSDASHLLDKNSRTLMKLVQLLELQEKIADKEGEGIPEAKDCLQRKINMYKNRIARRITKLATWGDEPRMEEKQKDKRFEKVYFLENKNVNVQKKS